MKTAIGTINLKVRGLLEEIQKDPKEVGWDLMLGSLNDQQVEQMGAELYGLMVLMTTGDALTVAAKSCRRKRLACLAAAGDQVQPEDTRESIDGNDGCHATPEGEGRPGSTRSGARMGSDGQEPEVGARD